MIYYFTCAHSGCYDWCQMCSIMELKTPPKCYITQGTLQNQLEKRKKYSKKVFRWRYGYRL